MPGGLQFVLILPDGSKSLIPAEWTDFKILPCAITGLLNSSARWMTCCVFAASSMLSCAALPTLPVTSGQARRAMPQLNLNFTDIPIPETHLWEQFDDEQKRLVIETLARLLVKAIRDQTPGADQ